MTTRPLPRVLLVEDTPPLARVYGEYLRFEPIALETVETGEAALAAIEREVPDVVLLDLRLPDMDGSTSCAGSAAAIWPAMS